MIDNKNFTVAAIYRPPCSIQHPHTVKTFCNDFYDLLCCICSSSTNIITAGDINISPNKPNGQETIYFNNVLDAFLLQQHVLCQTHNHGNTPDVIMTEENFSYIIHDPMDTYYISDHSAVTSKMDIPRPSPLNKNISYHDFKCVNHESLQADLATLVTETSSITDLQPLAQYYNSELAHSLEKHAPVINKTASITPKVPWCDDELKSLKRRKHCLQRK